MDINYSAECKALQWNGQQLQYLLIREWNTGVNQYHCWQFTRNAEFALLLSCACSVNKKRTVYIWIFFYLGNSCSFTIICYLAVTAPCQEVKGHGRIVLAIRMQQQLLWSLMCSKADSTFNMYFGGLEGFFKNCPIESETALRAVVCNQLKPD